MLTGVDVRLLRVSLRSRPPQIAERRRASARGVLRRRGARGARRCSRAVSAPAPPARARRGAPPIVRSAAAPQADRPGRCTSTARAGATCSAGRGCAVPTTASGCASASRTRTRRARGRRSRCPTPGTPGRPRRPPTPAPSTWYRKDFLLPSSSPSDEWVVRFESINNSATIWLNGHLIGSHTGAFLPFELALPPADLERARRQPAGAADQRRPRAHRPAAGELDRALGRRGRVVELRRDPARGLPAPRAGDRLLLRPGQPADRVRDVRRGRRLLGRAGQQLCERAARRAAHQLRRHDRVAGAADDRGRVDRDLHVRGCGSPRRCCGRRPRRTSIR